MHLIWRATTYLYLTAAVTAVLIGSAKDILATASLAGVLALQAAMRRRHLIVLAPVVSPAMASRARLVRLGLPNLGSHRQPIADGRFPRVGG